MDVKIEDTIELVDIERLQPYQRNNKKHPKSQIDRLALHIQGVGWDQPIVVDENMVILKGHGRLEAAKQLKLGQVPVVIRRDLSEAQKKAVRIADNKLAELAEWDMDNLKLELDDLELSGFELEELGFGDDELDELLPEREQPSSQGNTDPDDVPEVADNPYNVQRGQVWQLGKHRLMCGDSTSKDDVDKLMDDEKADICFTSPPYAQQRDYGVAKEKTLDWDALMNGISDVLPMAPLGQVFINLGLVHRKGEYWEYWRDWLDAMPARGWRKFAWYVWDQGHGNPGNHNGRLAPAFEFIWHFCKDKRYPNKIVECKGAGKPRSGHGFRGKDNSIQEWSHEGKNTQPFKIADAVIRVNRQGANTEGLDHPAMFPIALPTLFIESYTDEGECVYEPFCGAGSTLIACEKTNRICYGMEIDPHYCSIIIKRWEDFTGQKAELLGNC